MNDNVYYALAWYFVFVISVTFHEAAHAWAAKRGGDLTAYAGGQVSLNPWPHIKREPWGMLILPLIACFLIGWPFGYASTPLDPVWAYKNPKKAAWMSAAGPATNLVLALVAVLVIKIGILTGFFTMPDSVNLHHMVDAGGKMAGFGVIISMLFNLNLILVVLNLIPLPPLDGSGIVALFLPENTARNYQRIIHNPAFGLVGLLVAWFVISPLFNWIFIQVINYIIYPGAFFH
jgi:Zn-dependent protease